MITCFPIVQTPSERKKKFCNVRRDLWLFWMKKTSDPFTIDLTNKFRRIFFQLGLSENIFNDIKKKKSLQIFEAHISSLYLK